MVDESMPRSVRLTPEEQEFLEEMNLDFGSFTHNAIEEKKKKTKTLTRQQKLQRIGINAFYCILGMFFFMALGPQSNIIVIALLGGLGASFTFFGAINLYNGMKEDGVIGVRKKDR